MATTDNPLVTMTGQMNLEAGDEDVPNPEFLESALPGFKQTLTARRSIRLRPFCLAEYMDLSALSKTLPSVSPSFSSATPQEMVIGTGCCE